VSSIHASPTYLNRPTNRRHHDLPPALCSPRLLGGALSYVGGGAVTDTPRTLAHEHNIGSLENPHYVVDVEVAQTLERDLNRALAVVKAMRESKTPLEHANAIGEADKLLKELQ
jgi:hypothetical protein